MKIVFVKREPLSVPDGISQFLFSVSDALIRLGHEVICVTSTDHQLASIPNTYQFENYPRLESLSADGQEHHNRSAGLWFKQGRACLARHQPDLIVVNGAVPVRFAEPTALVAHDLQPRAFFLGHFGRIAYKTITYRLVDQILVTCPELIDPVARECLIPARRLQVIPTCIDTRRYAPLPLAQRLPVILHFGFHPYKNPRKSLAAFAAMKNRAARLLIIGSPNPDPTVLAEVAALPAEVRDRIEMPGIVSAERLKELLGSARVLSAPSPYVIPVASPTVMEAMAAHTPCVISTGISKIVATDGMNCFIEPTVAGMARRFDELLGQDAVWSAISSGAAATKANFDSLTVAKQYLELAQKMARPRR
jgi:glycosyltransferase involved in cell wall biosynthesis